jgi:hypothetical protein
MANYRSALGKPIDMSALAAKNEKTRAVGNMKVNARGDTIDSNGKVLIPVTQKVAENYSKTVGNRSAQVVKKQTKSNLVADNKPVVNQPTVNEVLTTDELELEQSFDDDVEVEQIRAKEKNNGK